MQSFSTILGKVSAFIEDIHTPVVLVITAKMNAAHTAKTAKYALSTAPPYQCLTRQMNEKNSLQPKPTTSENSQDLDPVKKNCSVRNFTQWTFEL